MTRRFVYGIGLWVTIAATAMTIASIVEPRWISYEVETTSGRKDRIQYGLHQRCSTLTGACEPFPEKEDCHGDNREFCSVWRSSSFLMSFCVVVQLATLLAYVVVILGGKQKRDQGWKVIALLTAVAFAVEAASMSMIAFLYDHDDRFFLGWKLDASWILCTVSWITTLFAGVGLVAAGILMPEEGGYEVIPNASVEDWLGHSGRSD